jgi:hypothetical protein
MDRIWATVFKWSTPSMLNSFLFAEDGEDTDDAVQGAFFDLMVVLDGERRQLKQRLEAEQSSNESAESSSEADSDENDSETDYIETEYDESGSYETDSYETESDETDYDDQSDSVTYAPSSSAGGMSPRGPDTPAEE